MTTEELKKYMIDSYKDIFGEQYDSERANASVERILAEHKDLEEASKAAQAVVERTRVKVEQSKKNFDNLFALKESLHDAPSEVKGAFNTVAEYFDTEYFGILTGVRSIIKNAGLLRKIASLKSKRIKLKEKENKLKEKADEARFKYIEAKDDREKCDDEIKQANNRLRT